MEEIDKRDSSSGGKVDEKQKLDNNPLSPEASDLSYESKPSSLLRRTTGPARKSRKGGWTKEEDELLEKVVKQYNGKHWKKIAEHFSGRTDVQCLHRWQKVLNPDLVKGTWTKEEDDLIRELVKIHGVKKWSEIARSLPGRIGKQCRERWHNHLNPAIRKDAWTEEEERTLIYCHQLYGNKWADISKHLPGRADNSIKNHWNCSLKKRLDTFCISGVSPNRCTNAMHQSNQTSSVQTTHIHENLRVMFAEARDSVLSRDANHAMSLQKDASANRAQDLFPHGSSIVDRHIGNQNQSPKAHANVCGPSDTLASSWILPSGFSNKQTFHSPKTPKQHAFRVGFWDTSVSKEEKNVSVCKEEPYLSGLVAGGGIGGLNQDDNRVGHLNLDCGTPFSPHSEIEHEPTLSNDLSNSSSSEKIFGQESYAQMDGSSVFFSPPSCSMQTSSCPLSPMSILRNAAKTFKNMPSILRKRRCSLERTGGETSSFSTANSTLLRTGSTKTVNEILQQEGECRTDLSATENFKARKLLSYDSCMQSVHSIDKKLELEFDKAWDISASGIQ